jgi:hypothetical protein
MADVFIKGGIVRGNLVAGGPAAYDNVDAAGANSLSSTSNVVSESANLIIRSDNAVFVAGIATINNLDESLITANAGSVVISYGPTIAANNSSESNAASTPSQVWIG